MRAIADEAVAMARRVGEAQPLAAALTGALHARWRPGRAAERLPLAAELIELTEAHEEPKCAADAHVWRASALLELCRLDEADAHLARHAELVAVAQQPALQIHCDAVRAMRAGLEGDYERATRIARELHARGERDEAEGRLARRSTPRSRRQSGPGVQRAQRAGAADRVLRAPGATGRGARPGAPRWPGRRPRPADPSSRGS